MALPSLVQLEYLLSVDRYRHFGIAAEKCFVTQPTLSMQIKKAEEALGVVIFDRSKQPIVPTDLGRILLEQARIIVQEAKQLESLVAEFKGDVSGQLRLGVIPTLAPYLLPKFVGSFLRAYPKVSLQIWERTTEDLLRDLQRDLLDVALLVTPLEAVNLQTRVLFYEGIEVLAHRDSPLWNLQDLAWEDLGGGDLWTLSEGHCFRHQTLRLCGGGKQIRDLALRYESGSLEALRRLVQEEGGHTLMPSLALEERDLPLRLKINGPRPLREVSLVHLRHFAKARLIDLLAASIRASVPADWQEIQHGRVVKPI